MKPQMSVSTIAKILHISNPLTPQHIKVLVHARLVEKQRTGKRFYLNWIAVIPLYESSSAPFNGP